jgi:hypothetical protein
MLPPRYLDGQPPQDFIVQRVPFSLAPFAFGLARRKLRVPGAIAARARGRWGVGLKSILSNGLSSFRMNRRNPLGESYSAASSNRERLCGRRRRRIHGDGSLARAASQLLEQLRFQTTRIENRLQTASGPAPGFVDWERSTPVRCAMRERISRMICSTSTRSPRSPRGRLFRQRNLASLGPPPIGTATSTVEVTAAALVVIHRHRVSTF